MYFRRAHRESNMKRPALALLLSLVSVDTSLLLSIPAWASNTPVPSRSPGTVGSDITQKNQSTVCLNSYSKTAHTPVYYTYIFKNKQLLKYGCIDMSAKRYKDDLHIPSGIDGNPHARKILWLESRKGAWNFDEHDQLEFEIYRMICVQKIHACESAARDDFKLDGSVQRICAWKSLSSWSWVWSCRLK